MKRSLSGLMAVMIMALLWGQLPVMAQETTLGEEELGWLAQVQAAMVNLKSLDYFQSTSTQSVQQTLNMGQGSQAMTIDQSISQDLMILVDNTDGEIPLVASTLDQVLDMDMGTGVPVNMAMTMEMVMAEGEYLMRYSSLPSELANQYPEGWFEAASRPELSGINFDTLSELTGWESLSLYTFNEEVVLAIKPLPEDTIDGQPMQVFQLIIAPIMLLEVSGLGEMFNTEAMGVDDQFMTDLYSKATYSLQVWIGEDGLLHRMDTVIVIENLETQVQGQALTLSQETQASVIYFDFNIPLEIEIPVVD